MNFCKILMLGLSVTLLASCSTVTPPSTKKIVSLQSHQARENLLSSEDYLDKAASSYTKTGDINQRNQWLLKAAESFQGENNCNKSLKLLGVIEPELQDTRQQTQGKLIQAECYLRLPTPAVQQAQSLIPQMAQNLGFEERISRLQVQLYAHQGQWLKASNEVLLTAGEIDVKSNEIWDLLQNLALPELEEARLREDQLQAWLQLSIIQRRFALLPEDLIYAVVEWQSRFYNHPLSHALPPKLSQALSLEPLKIDKIAVLLPLSGRLANQGLAIKEGILAAYLHNLPKVPQPLGVDSPALVAQHNAVAGARAVSAKQQLKVISGTLPKEDRPQQIRFFDSASKSPEEMNDLLSDYDLIIGPLLKEKVSALLELLPANKPILALNRIEPSAEATVVPVLKQIGSSAEPTLQLEQEQDLELEKKEVYYFALDPEDEAQHIARHLREQGFKRPIIFSATGHTTQRMADAFIHAWKASDKSPVYIAPDLAIFTNSKDMRRQVSRLLDVSQSKTRIKQLESLATVEVYAVERNRRDIDAIVLFANPIQTELLNPIIESSLSPFARKTLSVFASSRSYSMDLSKNNLRDLRNLSFSDMPWTLPNHPWPALATRTATLWPQRQGNLLRLFALGYDAYQVLPKLRHLSLAQHSSIKGLTGELSMDSEGQLHRRLSWAKIVQDRVTLLAMD